MLYICLTIVPLIAWYMAQNASLLVISGSSDIMQASLTSHHSMMGASAFPSAALQISGCRCQQQRRDLHKQLHCPSARNPHINIVVCMDSAEAKMTECGIIKQAVLCL